MPSGRSRTSSAAASTGSGSGASPPCSTDGASAAAAPCPFQGAGALGPLATRPSPTPCPGVLSSARRCAADPTPNPRRGRGCEQRRSPELRVQPTAVVQYNDWKGDGLIAVSYEARKFGEKRSMRGDEAKRVCPGINLVQVPVARGKADLNLYRSADSEVVAILSRKGKCERASIDEVYFDPTDTAKELLLQSPPDSPEQIFEEAAKSNVLGLPSEDSDKEKNVRAWLCRVDADYQDKLLACGAIIVVQLRVRVLEETQFTCSAGIAHNKVYSDHNNASKTCQRNAQACSTNSCPFFISSRLPSITSCEEDVMN